MFYYKNVFKMVWEHFLDSNILFGAQIENFETILNPQTHFWRKTFKAQSCKKQRKYWKCTNSLLNFLLFASASIRTSFHHRATYHHLKIVIPRTNCRWKKQFFDPPKRIIEIWSNRLRWRTPGTCFRSSQNHLSIQGHD